jgi:hypothetical protein
MKFYKKPIEIDAVQFRGDNWDEISDHFDGYDIDAVWMDGDNMVIRTIEGYMTARLGDWIIKGINGEFYPCKSEIFRKTYEPLFPHAAGSTYKHNSIDLLASIEADGYNCECQEGGVDAMSIDTDYLRVLANEFGRAEQSIQRIREYHNPIDIDDLGTWIICQGCSNEQDEDAGYINYPCSTIKLLDGDE